MIIGQRRLVKGRSTPSPWKATTDTDIGAYAKLRDCDLGFTAVKSKRSLDGKTKDEYLLFKSRDPDKGETPQPRNAFTARSVTEGRGDFDLG